ncbi:MAG: hydantoinase/oxoprolinase family protein [Acidobacteriota bacterium]
MSNARWRIRVDTGGTFTDCLAYSPQGERKRVKVLSSSTLRAQVVAVEGSALCLGAIWRAPDGFLDGAQLRILGDTSPGQPIMRSTGGASPTATVEDPSRFQAGSRVEILFDLEAPVLAAYLVTGTPPSESLPPLDFRLATTRGTNALLERRGARVAFLVTRGFADLLTIGNQQRPDLFALAIVKPEPLYAEVIEVDERLSADGSVLRELDLTTLEPYLDRLRELDAVAVAFLHSYRNPAHERAVADYLGRQGIRYVSVSSTLSPTIEILPRAQTAVVDAYLRPILDVYLQRVHGALGAGSRLHVMSSAGGLAGVSAFHPKDSLLSGPAGGVVGAAAAARGCGVSPILAFDMGGTSTDVSRWHGDFVYRFRHQVGSAHIAAPALEIETVAAGGGSVCGVVDGQLRVGPESMGASPGPACYGAGGLLTLTDVNLLLGRLDPARFGIPIDVDAAQRALDDVLVEISADKAHADRALAGFLEIADERMAGAIRRISVRRGYDPRHHTLVAFGGAGGQHACGIADRLGMARVVLPADAGLLSALGLDAAVIERFVAEQVVAPLEEVEAELDERFAALVAEAIDRVRGEGVDDAIVRRRLIFLRLVGQESSLEIEYRADGSLRAAYDEAYRRIYGYAPPARPVEVESLRVVASSRSTDGVEGAETVADRRATATGSLRTRAADGWRDVATFDRDGLEAGAFVDGPAIVFDAHASLYVAAGWRAIKHPGGAVVANRLVD